MASRTCFLARLGLGVGDFVPVPFAEQRRSCDVTLSAPVPADCALRSSTAQSLDVWKDEMEFNFGLLSREQFDALTKHYVSAWASSDIASGQTELFDDYDAKRKYELKDFLPVQIRALAGLYFNEEQQPLPEEPIPSISVYNESILVPNCWSTVFQVLRATALARNGQSQQPFVEVFSTDDKDAQRWFDEHTVALEQEPRFGDVLLVSLNQPNWHRSVLEHAVVFVDREVVFEKAGTGDKNPYRIIDLATVQREWPPESQGGLYTWTLRRPVINDDVAKAFQDTFSLKAMEVDARWPEFWSWSDVDQEAYSLGRDDDPTDANLTVSSLTLLASRRHSLQREGDSWTVKAASTFVV